MVRWTRTAQISSGKFGPAIAWAKEVSGYIKSKHNTPEIKVFLDTFGKLGLIRWVADYENLAQLEKINESIMADQDYWKLIDNAMSKGIFIDGQTHDVVMKEV